MKLFELPQIDSDLTVWFVLNGKEYEMGRFSISFGQSVDHRGQPQDEVRGGRMLVGLTQTLPDSIYRWAMSSVPKNGEIAFRSKTTNAPLRIEFINAYCVNFDRQITEGGGETLHFLYLRMRYWSMELVSTIIGQSNYGIRTKLYIAGGISGKT